MVVMGIDIGGTKVRCLIVSTSLNTALGAGQAGGANIYSSGPQASLNLEHAVRQALHQAGLAPGDVSSVCVGLAGKTPDAVATTMGVLTKGIGLPLIEPTETKSDLEIAFKSASSDPDGVLVFAGTGAGAARMEEWNCVQTHDGMGWLLGDIGSGIWLGREVLRAVAADIDQRGHPTAMTKPLLDLVVIVGDANIRSRLIAAVSGMAPTRWGMFAPLALANDGVDEIATRLLDSAAEALIQAVTRMGGPIQIITTGSLLAKGPLKERLAKVFTQSFAPFPVTGACAFASEAIGAKLNLNSLAAELVSHKLLG